MSAIIHFQFEARRSVPWSMVLACRGSTARRRLPALEMRSIRSGDQSHVGPMISRTDVIDNLGRRSRTISTDRAFTP